MVSRLSWNDNEQRRWVCFGLICLLDLESRPQRDTFYHGAFYRILGFFFLNFCTYARLASVISEIWVVTPLSTVAECECDWQYYFRVLQCNSTRVFALYQQLTKSIVTCTNGVEIEVSQPAEMPKVWCNKRTAESYAKLWTVAEEGGGTGSSASANVCCVWCWKHEAGWQLLSAGRKRR